MSDGQNDGWNGILDTGENILWQGRPDPGFVFRPTKLPLFVFGLLFAGFALFWMIMASQAGGAFWAFGLIHFSVGIGLAFTSFFGDMYRRKHTWYTLTDRRAFIATKMPFRGRKLNSYPITDDTMLSYDGETFGTIHFAHEYKRGKNSSTRKNIGFERIEDAQSVYRLLRDIQRGDRSDAV